MLAAAIDEQETYAEQLAELIDELLHPVLRRTDGHYQRLLATALLFGDAVGHCDAVSGHLDAAVGAARVVSKAVMGKTVNPAAQFQADLAAQRYGDHMRRAGNGIKALPEHIAETERRASVLIRAALPPVPIPDLTGFDALPRTLGNTGARLRIAYSIGLLRTLEAQVLGVTAVLRRRQDLADRKRRAALRAAYDRL
jgi:hypothetical protein